MFHGQTCDSNHDAIRMKHPGSKKTALMNRLESGWLRSRSVLRDRFLGGEGNQSVNIVLLVPCPARFSLEPADWLKLIFILQDAPKSMKDAG
jgi:hypothetical protein